MRPCIVCNGYGDILTSTHRHRPQTVEEKQPRDVTTCPHCKGVGLVWSNKSSDIMRSFFHLFQSFDYIGWLFARSENSDYKIEVRLCTHEDAAEVSLTKGVWLEHKDLFFLDDGRLI